MARYNLFWKLNEDIQESPCKHYQVFQYFTLYHSTESKVVQKTLLQLFCFVFLALVVSVSLLKMSIAKRWFKAKYVYLKKDLKKWNQHFVQEFFI